jgi:ERCC4-type nuclease
MKIYIDTREQLPLEFKHEYVDSIEIVKLDVGDYCARFKNGYMPNVRFERKSLGDLYGTLSQGYERFKREILFSQELDTKLIILVECSMSKVLEGYEHSKRDGESIVRQVFTLWAKYNILPVFCKNREEMSRYIIEFYSAIGRMALEELKKGKKDELRKDKKT